MAATKGEISKWFDEGVAKNARYMIICCDTFDYDDYPVFANTDNDCMMSYHNPGKMQRVMEVYDLQSDKAEQMSEGRAMRLPKAANMVLMGL
jgi:hypothetical protein